MPTVALASDVRVGQSPSFASSETAAGNLYIAGGNVLSAGKIDGELVAAGGIVLVNGPVLGDLFVGGGNITVLSDVSGNLRAGGGTTIINGKVGGDALVGGGQTTISGAGVGGDVIWAGGTLRIEAPVKGNLQLAGKQVVIDAPVQGSVTFRGGTLTLGKNTVINGDLDYTAQQVATIESGAVVKGATNFTPEKKVPSAPSVAVIAGIVSFFIFWKFLSLLLLALILGLFFSRFTRTVVRTAMDSPLLEMGRGLVVLIVLPVVSVMLLFTLIGIPLGILGLISYVALLLVASALAAITTGSLVHKWYYKAAEYKVSWQIILLGVVVYTIVGLIPFLGALYKFLLILLALGAIVKIKLKEVNEWR